MPINWGIMSAWQNWALVIFVSILIVLVLNAVSGCKCKDHN